MIFRLLNIPGIAGLAATLALGLLLLVQKGETQRWRRESARFEQLYAREQAALAGTVANYRTAAAAARVRDEANLARVTAAQRAISERTSNAYQVRLDIARSHARSLRQQAGNAAINSGNRGAAVVPGLSPAPGSSARAAGQDGLSQSDALIATEQAIRLDELIQWVRRQADVAPGARLPR